ncbi:MAG: M15 family metallopeptidase [Spirochaetota bacterium]
MKAFTVLVLLLVLLHPVDAETSPPGPSIGLEIRGAAELQGEGEPRFDAPDVLGALEAAYPHRVDAVRWMDGDWTVEVAGTRFFWAGGRLLPEQARGEADRYDPYPFYRYEPGPPEYPVYTDAERAALDRLVAERDSDPQRRHPGFMNALWRISDQRSAYARQKTTFFLGMKTMIHRELLEDLAAVEEAIVERSRTDSALARFLEELRSIEGYNYRRVDRTAVLSNHAYGIAVDFLPAYYGGRQVYWRWAYDSGLDWHSLAERDRFEIPRAFVEAFERRGFVWGGKWRFFDIIHFEYRPEILLLNGFELERH